MNEKELRLECLRLASKDAGLNTDAEFIVSKADQFYSFLRNRHEQGKDKTGKEKQDTKDCCEHQGFAQTQHLAVFPLTPEQYALLSQVQG